MSPTGRCWATAATRSGTTTSSCSPPRDREDYAAALERHYAQAAPPAWQERCVSAYATMHPSEDWAETFAHYLHLRDTLQTAAEYRVEVKGPRATDGGQPALGSAPREHVRHFHELLDDWLPLTYALNALNRSMGHDDLYPFVLAPPVIGKLELVHDLVGSVERKPAQPASAGSLPSSASFSR